MKKFIPLFVVTLAVVLFFNGKKYQGGQEYNISTPINRIPVFRKTNKLLDNIIFPEEADL